MHIKKLILYTPDVERQTQFYTQVLGLIPFEIRSDLVSFQIGESLLVFKYKHEATPYHFAINIPAYQDKEALRWLKSRVDILKDGNNEIQDFKTWNAKAIYFYDADKNIVEFISRNNLKQVLNQPFNQQSLIEISEIGLPTQSIEQEYRLLNKMLGVEVYDGSFHRFCAIGDEHGLFICIDEDRKWFPIKDHAYYSDFIVDVEVNKKQLVLDYNGGKFKAIE